MFSHPDYDGHQSLLFARDAASGLRGGKQVHSRTNLRSAARFALVIASLLLKMEPIVKSG